jgi:hypothetical protein
VTGEIYLAHGSGLATAGVVAVLVFAFLGFTSLPPAPRGRHRNHGAGPAALLPALALALVDVILLAPAVGLYGPLPPVLAWPLTGVGAILGAAVLRRLRWLRQRRPACR